MLRFDKALAACTKALSAYETSVKSAEGHLEGFFQEDEQRLQLTDEDVDFVTNVFHACLQFQKPIKVVLNQFYTSSGTTALRSDRHLYQVLLYLAILGLQDIGFQAFQRIVLSQHTTKMTQFLRFLFDDEDAIIGWMRDRWLSVYDEDTVDEAFVKPMLRVRPDMLELISTLENPEKHGQLRNSLRHRPSSGFARAKEETAPNATVPQPFNLTKPKPRWVPIPKAVSTQGPPKHKPIPKSTYDTPLEHEALERKREKNRRKAEQTLRSAADNTFACAPDPYDIRTKRQLLQQRKEEEELAQVGTTHRAKPAPATVRAQVPVKLNAAAILREENRYRQQLENEAARLSRLEAGEFNEREVQELEDKIKMEEEQQRLADIERKVLEGQLSREEAIIARQQVAQDRREAAMDAKEESRRLLQRARRLREKEDEMMRERAVEIQQVREQAAAAVDQALEEKRRVGLEVKAEREQLLREAEERAAKEMAQRQEIIREIRALETVRVERGATFDATATMNLGLMSEMSFVELQQRLSMLRAVQQEEEEARRAVIFDAKLAKDAMLQEKLEAIQQGRMQLELERAQKQTQKLRMSQLQRPKAQGEKLDALRAKLAARKAERAARVSKAATPAPGTAKRRAGQQPAHAARASAQSSSSSSSLSARSSERRATSRTQSRSRPHTTTGPAAKAGSAATSERRATGSGRAGSGAGVSAGTGGNGAPARASSGARLLREQERKASLASKQASGSGKARANQRPPRAKQSLAAFAT